MRDRDHKLPGSVSVLPMGPRIALSFSNRISTYTTDRAFAFAGRGRVRWREGSGLQLIARVLGTSSPMDTHCPLLSLCHVTLR